MKPNTKHVLKENISIKEFQLYIREMCELNGWQNFTVENKWLLLTEEIGELAKAIRNEKKFVREEAKAQKNARLNLEEEFADVLMYVADIANTLEVDLEKALKDKEKINLKRTW